MLPTFSQNLTFQRAIWNRRTDKRRASDLFCQTSRLILRRNREHLTRDSCVLWTVAQTSKPYRTSCSRTYCLAPNHQSIVILPWRALLSTKILSRGSFHFSRSLSSSSLYLNLVTLNRWNDEREDTAISFFDHSFDYWDIVNLREIPVVSRAPSRAN